MGLSVWMRDDGVREEVAGDVGSSANRSRNAGDRRSRIHISAQRWRQVAQPRPKRVRWAECKLRQCKGEG